MTPTATKKTATTTSAPTRAKPGLASRLFRSIGSFGFATILLLFLLLLTWLGTLEQVEHGLYEVQKKYFESLFLVHHAGPWAMRLPFSDAAEPLFTVPSIPIPLPGVYLVLSLLMLNLVVGGIVRLKKDVKRSGILIAHLGIVFLLAAGFVKFRWSVEGGMLVAPGQTKSEAQSFYDWEIAIRDAGAEGTATEQVVPSSDWLDLEPGHARRFTSDVLPFDVTVTRAFKNCRVVPKGPMFTGDGPVIDGYVVLKREPETEAAQNAAGLYATFTEKASGRQVDAILYGIEEHPFTLTAGGKQWLVDLRKEQIALPFAVRLDKFNFAMHPGTETARFFTSDVTKIEGGSEQPLKITMNEPLRHKGWTLYQADYQPHDGPPDLERSSFFEVVSNPSDQWPKWACWVIATGLALHFVMKLTKYVESEQRAGSTSMKGTQP